MKLTKLFAASAVLFAVGLGQARANSLTAAVLTADCQQARVDVTALLRPEYDGAVDYVIRLQPVGGGAPISRTIPIAGDPSGVAHVSKSEVVRWSPPLNGTFEVTGSVALRNASSMYIESFNEGQPLRLVCAAPPPPPPPSGCDQGGQCTQGCGPRFWRTPRNEFQWRVYHPEDLFADVFDVNASFHATLQEALSLSGSIERSLARQAVSALLNSLSPRLYYRYTEQRVIEIVREAYRTRRFKAARDLLERANDAGCPLN